ncbi:MAG: hypothetical protein HY695_01765 [Deltaproteobacteria bacterium]|nr:hypothetical protein [Deltaproteobacteria bacterium]
MRIVTTTISMLLLVCLLVAPALVADGRAADWQFRQITTLVTAPLEARDFRCHLVVVGPNSLAYRIQIFGPFGPGGAVLAEDDGTALPGLVYFTSVTLQFSTPAYCQIQLFGAKNKDLVRGALQATTFTLGSDAGGFSESSTSVEAR